jgi:hypothetical protein
MGPVVKMPRSDAESKNGAPAAVDRTEPMPSRLEAEALSEVSAQAIDIADANHDVRRLEIAMHGLRSTASSGDFTTTRRSGSLDRSSGRQVGGGSARDDRGDGLGGFARCAL